jgi:hypothetical protein
MISVDTGDLKNGNQTRLRFFGGGKEYEFSGRALVPSGGEGFQGVEVVLPHTDPLWDAFNANASLRYQIPGYQSQNLPLAAGNNAISNYLTICKTLAASDSSGGTSNSEGTGAKDAFSAARELNTVEGYQAFISAFPTGFYADLAKAHLKKLQSGTANSPAILPNEATQQPAQQPTSTPPLTTYTVGPDNTPWYKTTYNGNPNAAGVLSGGLELIAYCTPSREVGIAVRSFANGQYPQFRERVQQGLQRDRTADLKFQGEGSFRAMFHSNDGNELNMSYPVATSNGVVRSLMSGGTLLLSRPPFAAIFQLQGSRSAICESLNGCGAFPPECGSQGSVASDKPTKTERCSSRSVYVEGRGCVLKKFSGSSDSKKGCGQGDIRVEGKCMSRSEAVGYCGPGYRVRDGKCVHQNEMGKKKKSNMLKRNEGGLISEADCKRKGMVPEMGYCVEND